MFRNIVLKLGDPSDCNDITEQDNATEQTSQPTFNEDASKACSRRQRLPSGLRLDQRV